MDLIEVYKIAIRNRLESAYYSGYELATSESNSYFEIPIGHHVLSLRCYDGIYELTFVMIRQSITEEEARELKKLYIEKHRECELAELQNLITSIPQIKNITRNKTRE